MKPHYRDQIILGLIIVALFALWKAAEWLLF
jgi:hypothetical protein